MQQIERLESRTFANAYETIWLVFLRLAVDPMPDVAKRSRTVVDHINTQAAVIAAKTAEKMAKLKTPRKTTISQDDAQLALRPTFVVGSPATIAAAANNGADADLSTAAIQSQTPIKHVRSGSSEAVGGLTGPTPSFHATKFTPKRSHVFGTGPTHSTNEPAPTKKALITTEFVAWCSKRFAQPLLDTLQGSAGDGVTDRCDTKAAASDWAHHANSCDSSTIARIAWRPRSSSDATNGPRPHSPSAIYGRISALPTRAPSPSGTGNEPRSSKASSITK
jgi:hypothetical protein